MGIVIEVLREFELSSTNYRIEYNEGNSVHIHLDNVRIGMSRSQFEEFVQSVQIAENELEKIKNDESEIRK